MKRISKTGQNPVLGMSFAAGRLSVVQVDGGKGAIETAKSVSLALSPDVPLPDVARIGAELKNHLSTAGIGARRCVVALPADWIISLQTAVPQLSPEDLDSFLQLEAEKGFPCDPAELLIVRSTCRADDGAAFVTQLAVQKQQLEQLANVLASAGLKPVSFSLGLAALTGATSPEAGRITVGVETDTSTLLISAGGGVAAFRTVETITASEGEGSGLGRDLRITLEQMPAGLRAGLQTLELCGEDAMVRPLAGSLAGSPGTAGLTITWRSQADRPLGEHLAESIATRWLENGASALEFLPPRPGRWTVLLSRYNARRLASAGFAIGAAAFLAAAAFGWQEYRRWSLQSEWGAMRTPVTDLNAMQSLIRDYQPWYDTSFHSLSILRGVTASFPDNGSVTAKSFEIHGPAGVSVTGTARDNPALLRTLDQLRKTKGIQDLKIEQIHGKAPLQFTLSFRWNNPSGS